MTAEQLRKLERYTTKRKSQNLFQKVREQKWNRYFKKLTGEIK